MSEPHLTISVIIPAYNRADLVGIAIDSVLAQTRLPDEIIVVDDGSTDRTPDVLAKYQAPVKVIRQINAGEAAARNRGLDEARGDLIVFLDSDDVLFPDSLAHRARVFEQHSEVGVVYTDVIIINNKGEPLHQHSKIYPTPRPSGMILAELLRRNMIVISSAMVRRSPDMLRFDTTLDLAVDYDYWLRLAGGYQFYYLDEPLTGYRIPEGISFTVREWGLPGISSQTYGLRMKQSEIAAQQRAMSTDAFQQLSRLQRARIYCSHGMKNRMIGQNRRARQLFVQAIRSAPYYPMGYALLLLSLLGMRVFRWAVHMRRRVIRLLSAAR